MKRLNVPEMMDDFSINDERIDAALGELKIINKFLGGSRVTRMGLKKIIPAYSSNEKLKILDAGSGASDVLSSNKSLLNNADIFLIDLNMRICHYLKEQNRNTNIVYGDVCSLPFKEAAFHILHFSLFLHHFSEEEITNLIEQAKEKKVSAIIINDLRRSVFALIGIKILITLFSRNELVKNDAPISVRRGFVKSELKNILQRTNAKNYFIKRMWAFRWLVIIHL